MYGQPMMMAPQPMMMPPQPMMMAPQPVMMGMPMQQQAPKTIIINDNTHTPLPSNFPRTSIPVTCPICKKKVGTEVTNSCS